MSSFLAGALLNILNLNKKIKENPPKILEMPKIKNASEAGFNFGI